MHGDTNKRASDANYDPVQMDMSEESNNNNSSRESSSERAHSPAAQSKIDSSRTLPSLSDQRRSDHENHTANSKDEHKRGDRSDRSRHMSDKGRRSSYDDRRQRESSHRDRDIKRSRDDERKSRDDDKKKEKSSLGSSRDEKNDDREKNDKDHHYRDDRRDRNRDRNDRDRRRDRDRDRDRRHARDDRSKDRYRDDRTSYHKEKDRTRSRSRSRDRAPPPFRTMSYREEKGRNKLAQLEKLGIELKAPEGDTGTPGIQNEQNYYNPLTTATQGKYAEQIQKRKLLWANKSKQDEGKTSTAASTANTWVGTTFTHDQDGKVTAKFKRLMGIKDDLPTTPAAGAKPDILKKQEEMFNNMEQQYEVARATTHTQRGVGLGYATGGYQFPR
ncbi:PREDICTED: arginine/serine-rich coiled-coil protein 2 isoform X3 [Eufriesea mexicana]|nr:PREDICTED: arginine/serine-rich coiled-coil protein 2 isoform X3 [Eufriesea mexicana]